MDINPPTSNESLTFETTIRDTDDGFLIIGDFSCHNPHFPSFLPISRRICFRSFDPRKPAMLAAHNLSDEIWLAFAVDTRKVLSACYNKLYFCLFVTYLLLKMPLWFIPYLKVDNYEKYNDATIDSAYGLYAAYYFAVLIGALISTFTCLRMNGEGTHKKIKEIHNKYLEDFYNSGITLLYFRDGNAAYWIFRPTTIV